MRMVCEAAAHIVRLQSWMKKKFEGSGGDIDKLFTEVGALCGRLFASLVLA
jgi:hypothetical protein